MSPRFAEDSPVVESDNLAPGLLLAMPQLADPNFSRAVVLMIERGFRHLPVVTAQQRVLGVFSVRDALPREIGSALDMAEFNEQVNDALG